MLRTEYIPHHDRVFRTIHFKILAEYVDIGLCHVHNRNIHVDTFSETVFEAIGDCEADC